MSSKGHSLSNRSCYHKQPAIRLLSLHMRPVTVTWPYLCEYFEWMMVYAFDKHKVPRGFSFPLNRSVLDAALSEARITRVHCVYYWSRHSGDIVLRADYCGEANHAWAAGQASITLYAVPAAERRETESALIQHALPQLCTWLQTAEQAGNVWRGVDHTIVFHFKHGVLSATTT
jgi:hypothetical protein